MNKFLILILLILPSILFFSSCEPEEDDTEIIDDGGSDDWGLIGYYVNGGTDNLYKTTDGGVTFDEINDDLIGFPTNIEFIN